MNRPEGQGEEDGALVCVALGVGFLDHLHPDRQAVASEIPLVTGLFVAGPLIQPQRGGDLTMPACAAEIRNWKEIAMASQASVTATARRNVETIAQLEQQLVAQRSRTERWGSSVAHFFGSLRFVVAQILFFGAWMALNASGITWFGSFDPYPFPFLSLIVGIEFIFLTTFVLTNQKYQMRHAEQWSHLHLQLSMLTEQEVTKNMQMIHTICRNFEPETPTRDEEVRELAQDTEITTLVEEIEKARETEAN
jgi:uncharacterized membrane protein